MQVTKKRISAVALGVCLLLAAVFGVVVARADDWVHGQRTITVKATDKESDDIGNAELVVDAYKIANATHNASDQIYDYAFVAPFNTAEINQAFTDGDWEELGKLALDVVKTATEEGTAGSLTTYQGSFGEETSAEVALSAVEDEANGIYLVLPHGKDLDPSTCKAYSSRWEYTFNPSIVAIPTKDGLDDNGNLNTAYGDWVPAATIYLKATREPRYGSLIINKVVKQFSGEPATFVFHITGEMVRNGQTITYENYKSITYNGTPESATTTDTHIPVGMVVKVEEIQYDGARYELESGPTYRYGEGPVLDGDSITIVSDSEPAWATVEFTNKPTDIITGGNGVENMFTWDPTAAEGTGDWVWTPSPSERQVDDVEASTTTDSVAE